MPVDTAQKLLYNLETIMLRKQMQLSTHEKTRVRIKTEGLGERGRKNSD